MRKIFNIMILINFLLLFITISINAEENAETKIVNKIDEKTEDEQPASVLWKRFKLNIKNDSTILIYALKADIKEVLKTIDKKSKKYVFIYDTTVHGISPEISFPKEELDIAIKKILELNNLKRIRIEKYSKNQTVVYYIKRIVITKRLTNYDPKIPIEDRLKYRYDDEMFVETIKDIKAHEKEFIPKLIELLRGEDKTLRKASAYIFGELGTIEAIPVLISILKDGDMSMKIAVAKSLIKMEKLQSEFVPKMLEIYNESNDDNTKMLILDIISKINIDNKLKNQIFKEAYNGDNLYLKIKAGQFFILQGTKSAITLALENLNNEDPKIRRMCLDILSNSNDLRYLPKIKDAMVDSDSGVRTEAHLAERKIEYSSVMQRAENDSPKINYLREIFVNDSDVEIKVWAANQMLLLGSDGVESLQDIVNRADNHDTLIIAIKLLERLETAK